MSNRVLEPEILRRDAPGDLEPELELLARWMDSALVIPGTRVRIGLDSILGLLPGVGDMLTTLVSLYILGAARRYGVPRVTLWRMAANIAIDLGLGSIPIFGDVFDVFWKSNLKNVELLRRHLSATPAQERRARSGDWLFLTGLIALLLTLVVVLLAAGYGLAYLLGHAFSHGGGHRG